MKKRCSFFLLSSIIFFLVFNSKNALAIVIYDFETISQTVYDAVALDYGYDPEHCYFPSYDYSVNGLLIFSDDVKSPGPHVFSLNAPGPLLGFSLGGSETYQFSTLDIGNGYGSSNYLHGCILDGQFLSLEAYLSHGCFDGGSNIYLNINEFTSHRWNPSLEINVTGSWELASVPEPSTVVFFSVGLLSLACIRIRKKFPG